MSDPAKLRFLVKKQNNKCFYCGCEMNHIRESPQKATIEHIVDKWSILRHMRIEDDSNLAAACHHCNTTRGSIRNRIARNYYKDQALAKKIEINPHSTPSGTLFRLFGPVPQNLFDQS